MTLKANDALGGNMAMPYGAQVRMPAMGGATTDVAETSVYTVKVASGNDGSETVASVTWTPDASVTGANTNNFQITVFRRNSAGSLTGGTSNNGLVAQLVFNTGTNATAFVPKTITLSSPTNTALSVGDVLTCSIVHNGTGIQAPAGLLQVDVTRAR